MVSRTLVFSSTTFMGIQQNSTIKSGVTEKCVKGHLTGKHAFQVMDNLTCEVRQVSPRAVIFVDDVICSESRVLMKENLVIWRCALERKEVKVSRSKTG